VLGVAVTVTFKALRLVFEISNSEIILTVTTTSDDEELVEVLLLVLVLELVVEVFVTVTCRRLLVNLFSFKLRPSRLKRGESIQ